MTPVVKSLFTDLAMEITNDAMQIHGDMDIQKTKELSNYIEIIELPQFTKEQIQFKQLI
jgi:alkylation response protein AidB-like acyl-CoA dehydrogenase